MFIDMHCHILPGMDDGADSAGESIELITEALNSGTDAMLATPHYLNPRQCSRNNNRDTILCAFRELKSLLKENNVPVSLYLGAETLLTPYFEEFYSESDIITVNRTDYILVEFPFDERISVVLRHIDFLFSLGLIPIIAHPERYMFFQSSPNDVRSVLNRGCIFQLNKGSPTGKYGAAAQKLSVWLLDNDFVHIIASDCHSPDRRGADMGDIYNYMIARYSGNKINSLLHDNPKRVLLGEKIY